jgi:hypothetical protein
MTVGLATTLRNSRADAIKTAIDAGAGPGMIRVYDGTRPATGGSATNLLATLTCSDPSAGAAAAGALTLSAITSDASADATGTATWARIVDSTGTFVLDCSVGTSGADINFNTVSFVIGAAIAITSAVFTEGNP